MKLFVDDRREEPFGWAKATTGESAIELLKTGEVEEISLDHDMGIYGITGYDVTKWIEEQVVTNNFDPPVIKVHSQNPGGRQRIEKCAERIWEIYRRRKDEEYSEGLKEITPAGPGRIARFFWRLVGVTEFGLPRLKEGGYPPMPKCKKPKGGTGQSNYAPNFIEPPEPWPRPDD